MLWYIQIHYDLHALTLNIFLKQFEPPQVIPRSYSTSTTREETFQFVSSREVGAGGVYNLRHVCSGLGELLKDCPAWFVRYKEWERCGIHKLANLEVRCASQHGQWLRKSEVSFENVLFVTLDFSGSLQVLQGIPFGFCSTCGAGDLLPWFWHDGRCERWSCFADGWPCWSDFCWS